MTYSQSTVFSSGGYSYFAADCLTALGQSSGFTATDCNELATFMETDIYGGNGVVSCAGSFADGCLCDGVATDTLPINASGTWTVAGDTISLTDNANGQTSDAPFCVAGDAITMDLRAYQFGVISATK